MVRVSDHGPKGWGFNSQLRAGTTTAGSLPTPWSGCGQEATKNWEFFSLSLPPPTSLPNCMKNQWKNVLGWGLKKSRTYDLKIANTESTINSHSPFGQVRKEVDFARWTCAMNTHLRPKLCTYLAFQSSSECTEPPPRWSTGRSLCSGHRKGLSKSISQASIQPN